MQPARLGFIGCGSHSTHNLYPMLRFARCKLVATCDVQREAAERNAAMFGGRPFTDVDAMLDAGGLDGVMICGSPQMHADLGRKVLSRGLPVFVEKPPAATLAQAEELVRQAEANGTFVMVGYMKRFATTYAKIRGFIDAGDFAVSSGLIRFTHWPNSDLTPMLLYMSIHPIDLAVSFFDEPAEVASCLHDASGVLSLALTIRFVSGRWVQLMLGGHGPRIQEHVELSGVFRGKHGYFAVDNVEHMELHTAGRDGIDLRTNVQADIKPELDLADIQTWRPDYAIPNLGQTTGFFAGYIGEVREFADAIVEKRKPRQCNAAVLPAMRIVDAVLRQPNGTTRLNG